MSMSTDELEKGTEAHFHINFSMSTLTSKEARSFLSQSLSARDCQDCRPHPVLLQCAFLCTSRPNTKLFALQKGLSTPVTAFWAPKSITESCWQGLKPCMSLSSDFQNSSLTFWDCKAIKVFFLQLSRFHRLLIKLWVALIEWYNLWHYMPYISLLLNMSHCLLSQRFTGSALEHNTIMYCDSLEHNFWSSLLWPDPH